MLDADHKFKGPFFFFFVAKYRNYWHLEQFLRIRGPVRIHKGLNEGGAVYLIDVAEAANCITCWLCAILISVLRA